MKFSANQSISDLLLYAVRMGSWLTESVSIVIRERGLYFNRRTSIVIYITYTRTQTQTHAHTHTDKHTHKHKLLNTGKIKHFYSCPLCITVSAPIYR